LASEEKEKQNKTYQMIQKYLLFLWVGFVGRFSHEWRGAVGSDERSLVKVAGDPGIKTS
jgi:hypothetical protein